MVSYARVRFEEHGFKEATHITDTTYKAGTPGARGSFMRYNSVLLFVCRPLELLLQSVRHKSTIEPQRGPCCMCTLSGTRSWNAASISVLMAATTACSATGSRSGTSNMSSSCT